MTLTSIARVGLLAGSVLLSVPCGVGLAQRAGEEPIIFTAQNGETADAFRGQFLVPENRADPDSRMITISYVRFAATGPQSGPPIIYLAGGPGGSGSGTAQGRRFPLFMEMREHGDVIAFDQRGTGSSEQPPTCVSSEVPDPAGPASDLDVAASYRAALDECVGFWQAEGVDLLGYTTRQSVVDLSDLRTHLGADSVVLWGISYGSHLALAAVNERPDEIDRVIIASAEGLDQTVKLPARTDAYFERLQAAVNSQPEAAALYPDIAGLMRRVHARLEVEPVLLDVPSPDGRSQPVLLQRSHLQQLSSALIADPSNAAMLLDLYGRLDQGDPSLVIALLSYFGGVGEPVSLRAMPTAMDMASGISAERRALFERQAPDGLIGSYLNFPMPQLDNALPGLDLGPDFRRGPVGDTPLLLLTGTLDGRTYPEGQSEAVAGLTGVTQVTVRNAGHNLFMTSPVVAEVMADFMRGEPVRTREIVVPLPDFTHHPMQR